MIDDAVKLKVEGLRLDFEELNRQFMGFESTFPDREEIEQKISEQLMHIQTEFKDKYGLVEKDEVMEPMSPTSSKAPADFEAQMKAMEGKIMNKILDT